MAPEGAIVDCLYVEWKSLSNIVLTTAKSINHYASSAIVKDHLAKWVSALDRV